MARKRMELVQRFDIAVELGDEERIYSTLPVDNWRCERITGSPVRDALGTYQGISVMAWCAAQRVGEAPPRVKGQTELEAVEAWVELTTGIFLLEDEEAPAPVCSRCGAELEEEVTAVHPTKEEQ